MIYGAALDCGDAGAGAPENSILNPETSGQEQLRAKFDEIDVDGNGSLSRQEVEAAFLQLGRSAM